MPRRHDLATAAQRVVSHGGDHICERSARFLENGSDVADRLNRLSFKTTGPF